MVMPNRKIRNWFFAWALFFALFLPGIARKIHASERGELKFKSFPQARYHFEGILENRIEANVEQWLLRAPDSNPGMVGMFHMRDREPHPNLVPWAGEFAGKYLISAVQALRMTDNPELRGVVARLVQDLIDSQAEDGYLGPFPKETRLKAHWDLWGHYHCMEGLLLWHAETGDAAALKACQAAADLACATFLNSDLRVLDAGSPEMNMAILHVLGKLHRLTRQPRYLQLMREIEKDWESAGDYLRTGLAGVEFYKTPKPRWESLHSLQGLLELYRITGEEAYRQAFTHHWQSIRKWDRRNTGGFSSGEQATGNPFATNAIETCCTVAWMALSIDHLQLTGEAAAADELELSFWNAALGSQHPSGRWWTYNTPMNGIREASAHSIVFQARAGTPELNCCSVNGPRALGCLSEWAVMETAQGLVVNYYGPGAFQGKLWDNTPVALKWETDYPMSGAVTVRVEPLVPRRFTLKLRIPSWSTATRVRINQGAARRVAAGEYLELARLWNVGDRVHLEFDFALRVVRGEREMAERVSVYRGPLLLAYDQEFNPFDESGLPGLDLSKLHAAQLVPNGPAQYRKAIRPWILLDVQGENGAMIRLSDFASAGVGGTRYVSWLPVSKEKR